MLCCQSAEAAVYCHWTLNASLSALFTERYSGDEIKNDDMGRARRMHEGHRKYLANFG